jgi:hypothetical protein
LMRLRSRLGGSCQLLVTIWARLKSLF